MNFYEKFKDAPTKDLIKIRDNPVLYQEDAVKAAIQILTTRTITEEDILLARQEIVATQRLLNRETDFIKKLLNKIEGWLRYLVTPSETLDVQRWMIIFSIVLFLQYALAVPGYIKYLYLSFQCEDCKFSPVDVLNLVAIVYTPVMIYLLLMRSKWGFRLQVFSSALAVLALISFTINSGFYNTYHAISNIISFALSAAFLWFFYKEGVRDFFNQTKKEYWTTITVAGAVFVVGFIYFVVVS